MGKQQLLYRYPPDLSKAQMHRFAKRIFKGVQKDPLCEECECCDRKIGVEIVDSTCCYDKNQLAFLGPGIPLLFAYIKNSIVLLVVLALIFAGFCVYSNFTSGNCTVSSTNCEYNIFNTISFANKLNESDLLSIQNYILLAFVVVNILLFQYFRYNFRQIEEECDDIVNSPSDYAIILRRLPENTAKEDIQKMIDQRRFQLNEEEKKATQNLKIDHIVLSYAMGEYTRVKEKNSQIFKKLIDQGKNSEFIAEALPKLTETAKLAIVVFSRQQSKDFFVYKASIPQRLLQMICDPCTPLSNFRIKGQRVSIERAPEPDDVVWQNSKISISGGIIRKSIFNILGFIVLGSGGVAQYGLALLQKSVTDPTEKQIYSIGLSVIVSVFNFIILQFLIFTTHRQRNETLTEFNTVLTVKISLFQFLNTGIFVVLANFFAEMESFSLTQSLPTDVTVVMLMNAITPNVSLWVLSYFEITGKVFRWLVRTEKMKVTQIEANEIWEGPLPEIPYKYAYILKTLWLTAFYAPLVPIVVPISVLGLGLNYMIEKYLYRYIYSAPNMLSDMVNDSALEMMEYFPLIISMGEFIIFSYIKNYEVIALPLNWSIPIYISIALSMLNLVLPMDQLNKCFKLKIDDLENPPYEKVEDRFQVTYQMTNPAYACKKKRKRDVFLFNQIFGGQGKNAALNMSQIIGLDQTNRPMIKDQLLNKNYPIPNQNVKTETIHDNEMANVSKLKQGDTTMNTTQQNLNRSIEEDINPFSAFLKNINATPQTGQTGSNSKNNEASILGNISMEMTSPSPKLNATTAPNFIQQPNNNQQANSQFKGPEHINANPQNSFQKQSQIPQHQRENNNILPKSLIQGSNGEIKQQRTQGMEGEIKGVSPSESSASYKNLTKDINFKYNNSSSSVPMNSHQLPPLPFQAQNHSIQPQNAQIIQQMTQQPPMNSQPMKTNENQQMSQQPPMNNQPMKTNENQQMSQQPPMNCQQLNANRTDAVQPENLLGMQNKPQTDVGNEKKDGKGYGQERENSYSKDINEGDRKNVMGVSLLQNEQKIRISQEQGEKSRIQAIRAEKTASGQLFNSMIQIKQNHDRSLPLHDQHVSMMAQPITSIHPYRVDNSSNLTTSGQLIQHQQTIPLGQGGLSNQPYKYPNQTQPTIQSYQNIASDFLNPNPTISQLPKYPKPFTNNFIHDQNSHQIPQNYHDNTQHQTQPETQVDPQIPLLSLAARIEKTPHKDTNKHKEKPSHNTQMADFYANYYRQKEIEKQNRDKFLEEGVKELNYQVKRFTKKGVIFYQTPESTPKSSFPHVQIHVPGLKPLNELDEQGKSRDKRRNFGRNESGEKERGVSEKRNEGFKSGEVYNPRFMGRR